MERLQIMPTLWLKNLSYISTRFYIEKIDEMHQRYTTP